MLSDSDEEEVRAYLEECANLPYDMDSDQVNEFQETSHSLLVTSHSWHWLSDIHSKNELATFAL
jgi:hypothetical protein